MIYFLIFIFGLCIGSFLNVIICRLETEEKISNSRSHCPKCGHILHWYDLIPVLSFVLQKAKCRYCNKKISWQYPVIEIFTGCLFLLILNFQFSILNEFSIFQFLNLFYYFFIVSCLIIIFVYDLKYCLILDKIIYPAIGLAFIYLFFQNNFLNYFFSALGASLFFFLIVLITKGKGMGIGDIKLAFFMGLVLGWPKIMLALMLAFFSGALIGVILLILGRKKMSSEIPFGPFLAGATFIVLLINQDLINWIDLWIKIY